MSTMERFKKVVGDVLFAALVVVIIANAVFWISVTVLWVLGRL